MDASKVRCELNVRHGKHILGTVWKTPEELTRMCRHGFCPVKLWGCPFHGKVQCIKVEPYLWARLLRVKEEGDAQDAT